MTRVTSPRRRERPRRLVVAALLLLASVSAALATLVVGSTSASAAAAVAGAFLAVAAARLLHLELVHERRVQAEARVTQARAFRALFVERSAEQARFAAHMRGRVLTGERVADELRGLLRLARTRAEVAEASAAVERERADDAARRVAQLELAVGAVDPIDDLAAWDPAAATEPDTVLDLVAWERRAASARVHEQRKRA